jgi:hypothetical protein
MIKPKRLFKYKPFESYSLDSIKNQHFCFSNRRALNDPLELNFEYHFASEEEAKIFWMREAREAGFSEVDLFYIRVSLSIDFIRSHYFQRLLDEMNKDIMEDLDKVGILSLTENENDDYMWGEYGGKHTGYCLQLYPDYQHQFFREEMYRVEYSDEPTKVNMATQSTKEYHKVLFQKKTIWKRENEWRIALPRNLHDQFELVKLDRVIEKIIIGKHMTPENERAIREIAPIGVEVSKNS